MVQIALEIDANAAGALLERVEPYAARVRVNVDTQENGSFVVPLLLHVHATAVAQHTVWGGSSSRLSCTSPPPEATEVTWGAAGAIQFGSCDALSLPVDHSLPSATDTREYTARLYAIDAAENRGDPAGVPQAVSYLGGAHYSVAVSPAVAGGHLLQLHLGSELIANALNLNVVCPWGLAVREGRCECPAGKEATEVIVLGTESCSPCAEGSVKRETGNQARCIACPPGTRAEGGGVFCDACEPGKANPTPGQVGRSGQ